MTATYLLDLSKAASEIGLRFIVFRENAKQYQFCKGTRVIHEVRTADEARRFLTACKLNPQTIASL